ncbi:MAG: hypothetical protein ACI4D8_00720 [Wujia sp.]
MKMRMSLEQRELDTFIDNVIRKYHFDENDRKELMKVYEQLQLYISPYAAYRINQRVTGVKEIDNCQSAIVVMTLGAGIDRLSDRYTRAGELDSAYKLECIANELLLCMYKEFNTSYARFHRRYVQKYVFIGNEIPLSEVQRLIMDVYGRKSEVEEQPIIEDDSVTANEYGVLNPSKSVVFYALLSENPKTLCEGICMGCGNTNCENRMNTHIQENRFKVIEDCKEKKENTGKIFSYGYQRIFGN